MSIVSRNPSTGEIIKQFESYSDEFVDGLISNSYFSYKELKKFSINRRTKCMMAVANILNEESEKLGKILTQEMGKTHKSAIAEIKKSALFLFAISALWCKGINRSSLRVKITFTSGKYFLM